MYILLVIALDTCWLCSVCHVSCVTETLAGNVKTLGVSVNLSLSQATNKLHPSEISLLECSLASQFVQQNS